MRYVCITDAEGTVLVHKNLRTAPEAFERTIAPYREDLAVAAECVFVWYWIADLCARLGITFVLGRAAYLIIKRRTPWRDALLRWALPFGAGERSTRTACR